MANTVSARKRVRQSERNRIRNVGLKTRMKTAIRKFLKALDTGDEQIVRDALSHAYSMIDSIVTKGVIHKNKAARHKSRLTLRMKALFSSPAS